MNRAIHFKSVEAFFRENYGIELDNRCYENKANGYTYRVFFEKGTDIGLFTTNEDEEVVIAMKVIKDENDEEILVPVESDFEIEMIEEAYATLFADEEE